MNDLKDKSIKDKILRKLADGEVKMRPKFYFMIRTVMVAVTAVILALAILFLLSFVIFQLRFSGLIHTPFLGGPGIKAFMIGLPWLWVLVIIGLIAVLEYLLQSFSFTYKRPLVYSLVVLLIGASVLGFVVAKTPLHEKFSERAFDRRLPVAGGLYRGMEKDLLQHVQFGKIVEIQDNKFTLETRSGEQLVIQLDDRTEIHPPDELQTGDTVLIVGNKNNGTVEAVRVQKMPPDAFPGQMIKGRIQKR